MVTTSRTTSWELYTSNPQAWDAMLDACEEATTSIDLENFIFTPDAIGTKFIDVCARKAKQGVKVRFIWDAAGSFSFFGATIVEDLKAKGIELVFFKTLLPHIFKIHKFRSWYFRNHRRTLVVDGKIGFTGSTSISIRMEKWRDTNIRVEGPVVKDMQKAFERMWERAQGNKLEKIHGDTKTDQEFEYTTNNPFPRKNFLYTKIITAIRTSQECIDITVPYYVPTHRISRVIRLAARRGVKVRLILPEMSDFPTVDLGARTYFHSLLHAGVKIFLYKGKMIHTKSIVIDTAWATVGTLNLDNISLRYNFEANLVSSNREFVAELSSHFENDLKSCTEVTLKEWDDRFFVEKIATFLVKFLRMFL